MRSRPLPTRNGLSPRNPGRTGRGARPHGLHTGDIESTGPTIGYAINRTARIAAVAHGGQVLLSDTTRALVSDTLPAGLGLRDLGEHRLKDLRAPERLTQLVIEGLAGDFPPPRSLDARPNNLPTQLTTFVGREKELGDALTLLGGTRLLSLTGPGGTGKTRSSLQVADDFPDGIWFVALEPVRVPELVQPTTRVLGVADSRNRPAIDTLADHIGESRVLLVLDNFEQVVAAGSSIADLLRRCSRLACLVTTRITLRVSGSRSTRCRASPHRRTPAGYRRSTGSTCRARCASTTSTRSTSSRRSACSSPAHRRSSPDLPSPTRTRRPLPGSRRGFTGCPSRRAGGSAHRPRPPTRSSPGSSITWPC